MLRVKVELDHGGLGVRKENLGTVLIDNRSGLAEVSDYRVRVISRNGRSLPRREGLVQGHRRNTEPVLTLVRKALEAAGY